jgi:hypothetical protein
MLKILKTSSEKLRMSGDKTLAKGVEWVTYEIQDSLLYTKADDKAMQRMEKMKSHNQELETIYSWMEEYSEIKHKQKENIDLVLQKHYSTSFSLDNSKDFTLSEINTPNNIKAKQTFLNFSEECFVKIEDPTFDIFLLENEVGRENTLSTISSYIFINLGLFAIINYNNFENFIQAVTKGYNRANYYHNVYYKYILTYSFRIFMQLMSSKHVSFI